jgi:hypothetical protein
MGDRWTTARGIHIGDEECPFRMLLFVVWLSHCPPLVQPPTLARSVNSKHVLPRSSSGSRPGHVFACKVTKACYQVQRGSRERETCSVSLIRELSCNSAHSQRRLMSGQLHVVPFYHLEKNPVPMNWDIFWVPEPVSTLWKVETSLPASDPTKVFPGSSP